VGVSQDYLERIGLEAPLAVDADGLRSLHAAHLRTVPFENLDIHLGVPIVLDPDALLDKIVTRRRGGYCYELNGAFAGLLHSLGFRTSLLEARVFDDAGDLGIRFDHLCLQVDLDQPYLVDVGFGENFLEPLLCTPGVEQVDATGTFTIMEGGEGWFDVLRDGRPQYRYSPTPRRLRDFASGNRHQQISPDSPFRRAPMCTLATPRGRITISGSTLIETQDGSRTETKLSDEERSTAYRERFGIELDAGLPVSPPRYGE
jgi:N-hydroxyarylamine O-acetyltransferase